MSPDARAIAAEALALIRDPERFTAESAARDAAGEPVPGATAEAVAWSALGAVNRLTVLEHNTVDEVPAWREVLHELRALGVRHTTPHAEAIAVLEALA